MAVVLELRYSKEEILEAYLNEIYLGQDGHRAIHGFGLAQPLLLQPAHRRNSTRRRSRCWSAWCAAPRITIRGAIRSAAASGATRCSR